MSDTECSRPLRSSVGSCIQALAAGWITSIDLCPYCTRRFMAALEWLGEPLTWHADFIEKGAADGPT